MFSSAHGDEEIHMVDADATGQRGTTMVEVISARCTGSAVMNGGRRFVTRSMG